MSDSRFGDLIIYLVFMLLSPRGKIDHQKTTDSDSVSVSKAFDCKRPSLRLDGQGI